MPALPLRPVGARLVAGLLLGPPAGRELRGLLDPLVTHRTALEGPEVLVDPAQVHLVPRGDLREMEDAELVQDLRQLGADPPDQLEIVGLATLRSAEQGRLELVRNVRE